MTNLEPVDSGGADETPLAEVIGELNRLLKRLRSLSPAAWRPRRSSVLDLLDGLIDLSARFEGTTSHALPDLPDYALADAVAVTGFDCVDLVGATRDSAALGDLNRLIQVGLRETL